MKAKHTVFILAIIFFFVGGCKKEESKVENFSLKEKKYIKEQVEDNFKRMMNAAFNKDTQGYFFYVDNQHFTGMDDHGKIIDSSLQLERVFRRSNDMIERYHSFKFNRLLVVPITKNVVTVVAEVTAHVSIVNQGDFVFTGGYSQVWRKKDNDWRVASSSSHLKPEKVAIKQ